MAFVNAMRFNRNQGAVVSDEDLWNERFRRRLACDNLHPLFSPEMAETLGLHVVYGGAGYPPLHREVVDQARQELEDRLSRSKNRSRKAPVHTVAEVAAITLDILRDAVRARIDQRLMLYYGFTTDDLNRGWFERDGERVDIRQKKVKEWAHKVSTGNAKDRIFSMIMNTRALIAGYDAAEGFDVHVLETAPSISAWIQDGVDTIGSGKYASAMSLGRFLNNRPLPVRLAGTNPAEGMYELLLSALTATEHFQEAGGNINIVLIDSTARKGLRYQEIFDDRARLAGETVRAAHAGLLPRDKAMELLQGIIFEKMPMPEAHKHFEDSAISGQALELLLRGYKMHDVKTLAGLVTETPENGRKSKGNTRNRKKARPS